MKRKIDIELISWKHRKDRKVLLLRGARQVGKTYAMRELGKSFLHFLEVNLEREKAVHAFFEGSGSLDPAIINEKLATYFGVPILPEKTLLFLDEIQACPQALQALRFYQESMPNLHVVAAGSLLEFTLSEIPSFGVGRITNLFMYPMTFSEFLWATGGESLHALILKGSPQTPMDTVFHNQLLEKFRIYTTLGGMPAIVKAYAEGTDLRSCQELIDDLVVTLRDDFAKYQKRAPVLKLRETFEAIAYQAGEKFKYAKISETSSSQGYKEAVELLVKSGLVHKIYHTAARGLPLGAQINPKKFKAILFDLGIHQRLLGLNLSEHMIQNPIDMINKGSLAETFVGLEIVAHGSQRVHPQLYYWHRESPASNAEVDYVMQQEGQILPIEVKSGTKGQMQSLFLFLKERGLPFGIRFSHENFGTFEHVRILPIYAVETLFHPSSKPLKN